MSTPVLTKSQQRISLSAKKTPGKVLKNVLVQPSDNYWPLLKHDHGAELENSLKKCLPVFKKSRQKLPWSRLKKMTREERSAARKLAGQDEEETNVRKPIVFGVNAVVRSLEKREINCVLLDANVDPALLIKHVVIMSQNQSLPTLIVHFLKKTTLEILGFPCIALGLRRSTEEPFEDHFGKLLDKVVELSKELSIKNNARSLLSSEPKNPVIRVKLDKRDKKVIPEVQKVSKDVYLYRSTPKERVFQPPGSGQKKWDDFISLDGFDDQLVDQKKLPKRFFESVEEKPSYVPLKVKRIRGNQFRSKATKVPKTKKK